MHPVEGRQLVFFQKAGGANVGRQHALFDHLVRVVAAARHDLVDLALVVENDRRFGGIEIDRPALFPRLTQ